MKLCKFSILVIFLLYLGLCQAQFENSKMSTDLLLLHQNRDSHPSGQKIPILIKGNLDSISKLVEETNGIFKYAYGEIAAVQIDVSALELLVNHPSLKRLEYKKVKLSKLFYEDSTADVNNRIRSVHAGLGDLPQAFRGEGIILGIIDDGFEWRHPDFLNADSSSRIQFLWDQAHFNPNYFEHFYGYGSSWNKQQIDAGNISHTPADHGTHVLGTAAGNASASGKYIGIAPQADIIAVSIDENGTDFLAAFVDACHFILNKAALLGKPCAINSSVGNYGGSHDGKDLYTELIDSMLSSGGGKALIQATGNARAYNMHWGTELFSGDTARIVFKKIPQQPLMASFIYADTADFNNVNFNVALLDSSTLQIFSITPSINLLRDFSFSAGNFLPIVDTLFYSNQIATILKIYAEQWAGVYQLIITIENPEPASLVQLTFSGHGKVDCWSHPVTLGSSEMLSNVSLNHYINPDNEQSIAGYWNCSDNVISVASYQNMAWMENYAGDTIQLFTAGWLPPGISHFTSLGPTRDGRQKPDLAAPGGQVMSSAPLSTLQNYRNSNFPYLDADGWHISNRGTSMAAPMVAGAAALYFQCRPWASCQDVKIALESSSRLDTTVFMQSSELPNIHWGYGKLDVYNLMTACIIYGCTDSSAINYNPLAMVDDNSCDYVTNLTELGNFSFEVFPNPFQNKILIKLADMESIGAEIILRDVLGRHFKNIQITESVQEINTEGLSSGIYFLTLRKNDKTLETRKVLKF